MSRPIVLPNKYGSPSAKLIEVDCKQDHCQWWHEPWRGCIYANDCEDVDSGPCGESCPKRKLHPRMPGWCKLVTQHD